MRVVGIDTKWDGPSFALMGLGDEGLKSPIWEKLRIFRLSDDILRVLKRDEIIAHNVEKEIIEKGERGIVWVGFMHSFIHYRQPRVFEEKVISEFSRMGFILHQKYGDNVFQISLQHRDYSPSIIYPDYHVPEPMINEFIESVMGKTNRASVGFDVSQSPFASLRDSTSYYYHFQPSVSFADIASGYIYLKNWNMLKICGWMDDYISQKMFIENKCFYKSRIKKKFNNLEELNLLLQQVKNMEELESLTRPE